MRTEDQFTYEQHQRQAGLARSWRDAQELEPEFVDDLHARARQNLNRPRGRLMTAAEFLDWAASVRPEAHAG